VKARFIGEDDIAAGGVGCREDNGAAEICFTLIFGGVTLHGINLPV
jgi:hypothetical protein